MLLASEESTTGDGTWKRLADGKSLCAMPESQFLRWDDEWHLAYVLVALACCFEVSFASVPPAEPASTFSRAPRLLLGRRVADSGDEELFGMWHWPDCSPRGS